MTTADWQTHLAQHDRWLRTVVAARVGERAAVDEVMQEVALAAVKTARAAFTAGKGEIENIGPWLYRVAVRQSLLYRRKRGRGRKLTTRFAEQVRPVDRDVHEPDPLEWLLADERRKLVRQALLRLPRGDREILLLKYTEDWSYDQLARHLGISQSAIEARLHRARGRLRKELTASEKNISEEVGARV